MVKYRFYFIHVRFRSGDEFGHRFFHFRRGGFEVRFAQIPIPFRHRFPVGQGACIEALQYHVAWWHGWFLEHARHVRRFPVMRHHAVGVGRGEIGDGSGNFTAQLDALQWPIRRRVNFVGQMLDMAAAFKNIFLRKRAGNIRAFRRLACDGVNDVADLHLGKVDLQDPAVRVVNVHGHLPFINAVLGICRHVHRQRCAIRLQQFQLDNRHRRIRQHIAQRQRAVGPLAFFREHLDEGFVLAFPRAIGPVHAHQFFLDRGRVGIWIFFQCDGGCRRQNFFGITKFPGAAGVTVGIAVAVNRRHRQQQRAEKIEAAVG